MTRPLPRALTAVATAAVALVIGTVSGCGSDDPGLRTEPVVIDRTTTSGPLPCDGLRTAERGLTEASLTAARADDAAKAIVRDRLAFLEQGLPADLTKHVAALRAAFEATWANRTAGEDPFDRIEYLNADQAIRRFIDDGCRAPTTTTTVPTTTASTTTP